MQVIERRILEIGPGQLEAYREWELANRALEETAGGFPDKRYCRAIAGAMPMGTIAWERAWANLAACDEAYRRLYRQAGRHNMPSPKVVVSQHQEFYLTWTPGAEPTS